MQYATLTTIAAWAVSASAALIQVAVGKNGLTYTPNDITAAVGDLVELSFFPKNHTVTQSSFANPTTSSPSNTKFTITINDPKPVWIYCSQSTENHCQSGMVAAINAPTTGNTLAAFEALAKNATTSTSPPNDKVAVGGVLSVGNATSSRGGSSSVGVESKIGTTSGVETITTIATSGGRTYATTYTTAVPETTVAASVSASGSSTTSSVTAKQLAR